MGVSHIMRDFQIHCDVMQWIEAHSSTWSFVGCMNAWLVWGILRHASRMLKFYRLNDDITENGIFVARNGNEGFWGIFKYLESNRDALRETRDIVIFAMIRANYSWSLLASVVHDARGRVMVPLSSHDSWMMRIMGFRWLLLTLAGDDTYSRTVSTKNEVIVCAMIRPDIRVRV